MPKSHPAPSSDAEPRDRTVRIGDQDVVYEDTGVRGGPTLVLVHGIGMGHSVFRALAGGLGTAGRVLALDLPGFGESPSRRVRARWRSRVI